MGALAAAGCVDTASVEVTVVLDPTSGPTGTRATVTVEADDGDVPIELSDGLTTEQATLDESGHYETSWEFVGEPGESIVLEVVGVRDDEVLAGSQATFTITEAPDEPIDDIEEPVDESDPEDAESEDAESEDTESEDTAEETEEVDVEEPSADAPPATDVEETVEPDAPDEPADNQCRVTAEDLVVEQFHDTDALSPSLREANALSSIRVRTNGCEFATGTFFVSISDTNGSGTVDAGDAFFVAPQPANGSTVEIGIERGGNHFLGSIDPGDEVTMVELGGTPFDDPTRLDDGSGWQVFDETEVSIQIIERGPNDPTPAYYNVDFGDPVMIPLP